MRKRREAEEAEIADCSCEGMVAVEWLRQRKKRKRI